MTEMYGHAEICYEGKDLDYTIGALIVVSDGTYQAPSLAIYRNYGTKNQEEVYFWDNEDYLIENLFEKVLLPWIKTKGILDAEAFTEILKIPGVSLDDFQGLYDLFVQAISRDFFYEYFKNKE